MIEYRALSECAIYYPIMAFWSYMEWYQTRTIPFNAVLNAYKERSFSEGPAVSYIALENTLPIGMVSLKNNDLWSRKDLNPWLASLYVVPEHRNRGIASGLIELIIHKAQEMDHERIFLFLGPRESASLEKFYTARGWIFYDHAIDNDENPTQIFYYPLKP